MSNELVPNLTIPEEPRAEVAAILATGFLRLKCRRGYVPEEPPDEAEPPPASEEAPEFSRN